MADDGHYVDVAVMEVDPGAIGPAATEARLRLGLEPLLRYELHDGLITAMGDRAITEHAETWTWRKGVVDYAAVHVQRGARRKVVR